MKRLLILLAFVCILNSCDKKEEKFTINGTSKSLSGEVLVLSKLTLNGPELIDSAFVQKEGSFNLSGTSAIPMLSVISLQGSSDFIQLAPKNGEELELNIQSMKFPFQYEVSGSPESEALKTLHDNLFDYLEPRIDLKKSYQEQMSEVENVEELREKHMQKLQKMDVEYKAKVKQFIKDNQGKIATVVALYQEIDRYHSLFNVVDDALLFYAVDSVMFKKYPNSEPVLALHEQLQGIRNMKAAIGQKAPNIKLKDPNGNLVSLGDYHGKYVLLDFWASWCAPCRYENPNLVKTYQKYKDEDFVIFQVSLDKDEAAWKQAIKNDKLDWVHVSDLKFWDSPVAKLYGIESIPSSFLIAPDGKIMAKNLFGADLEVKLEEIFK